MSRQIRRAEEQFQRLEDLQAELVRQREMIDHVAVVVQSVSVTQSHSGPIPAPSTMTEYKDAHPEVYAAVIDRFKQETEMVKAEQNHRHELDRFNFRIAAWGVGLAWGLMFSCFIAAVVFVLRGTPIAGFVSVIVAMTALAGNLVYARKKPPQTQSPDEESEIPDDERKKAV